MTENELFWDGYLHTTSLADETQINIWRKHIVDQERSGLTVVVFSMYPNDAEALNDEFSYSLIKNPKN